MRMASHGSFWQSQASAQVSAGPQRSCSYTSLLQALAEQPEGFPLPGPPVVKWPAWGQAMLKSPSVVKMNDDSKQTLMPPGRCQSLTNVSARNKGPSTLFDKPVAMRLKCLCVLLSGSTEDTVMYTEGQHCFSHPYFIALWWFLTHAFRK